MMRKKINLKRENLSEYGLNAAMHTADCIKTKKELVTEADALSAYALSESR